MADEGRKTEKKKRGGGGQSAFSLSVGLLPPMRQKKIQIMFCENPFNPKIEKVGRVPIVAKKHQILRKQLEELKRCGGVRNKTLVVTAQQ